MRKVDRSELMEQGFIVLREVIPPGQLESLRTSYETLVNRRGGDAWLDSGFQPRLEASSLIDETTANAVEIWLHENTLEVARQLLCRPDPAVTSMWSMCSPLRDHGPAKWHRDLHPLDMAPLRVLQDSLRANGPVYIQWNIPLYDDDVLWVVPGSHLRFNTDEENRSLAADPRTAVPGGEPVRLKAGDGVVYINYLLHWGSNYSTKLRRTLHGGHALFTDYPNLDFTKYLSPEGRNKFEEFGRRSERNQDLTESALRSVIAGNAAGFNEALGKLLPDPDETLRLHLAVYLCKTVYLMKVVRGLGTAAEPEEARMRAGNCHSISLHWGPNFADRFTNVEIESAWQRFEPLEKRLRADTEQLVPGFQGAAIPYYYEELSSPITVGELTDSWRN
jgi:hypothetical protein